jgi:hypothetical protein
LGPRSKGKCLVIVFSINDNVCASNGTLLLIVHASWGNFEDFDMLDKRKFALFLEYCVELCGGGDKFLMVTS